MTRTSIPVYVIVMMCWAGAQAQVGRMPVNEPLLETESAHFLYIYSQSLSDQVPMLARYCEEAYVRLTPVFKWTPRQKTMVLYADSLDEHNGMASVSPRPMIMVYAAGSAPESTIYEPGFYLRRTVFHEFAHILAMDAQYGFDDTMARIFGRVMPVGDLLSILIAVCAAPPGELGPRWYQEGLAIWAETEFSEHGRGRNSLANMILRMPVADQRVLSPCRWDLELPEWPYGEAAYLYGMETLRYAQSVAATNTAQAHLPGDLADAVSHSFLYYFNHRADPVLGMTFAELVQTAVARVQQREQSNLEALRAKPLTGLARLTPLTLQVESPRFGADNQTVYFCGHDEAGRDTLYAYHLATRSVEKLNGVRTEFGLSTLAASRDRKTLYYTRLDYTGRDRLWSEVYAYDPAKDDVACVARHGRYRMPAFSPDGVRMAAVRNERGECSLVEATPGMRGRLAGMKDERVWVKAGPGEYLVNPVYSPDGKHLVYVRADDAHSRLVALNRATGKEQVLVDWPCLIIQPTFSPAGDALVFTSDKSGVYNLYRLAWGSSTEPVPITHVLGGAFAPDFSPDGKQLAFVAYDSYGYYLAVLPVESCLPIAGALPAVHSDWPALASHQGLVTTQAQSGAVSGAVPGVTSPVATSASYNSLLSTRLDYWTPWFNAALNGDGVQGGLAASFSDYTGAQSVFALGGAESQWGVPLGSLVYQYSGLYPELSLYGGYGVESYNNLVEDPRGRFYDYNETVGKVGGLLTVPWLRVDRQWALSLGYQFTQRDVIRKSADDYRNRALLTTNLFEGNEGAAFVRLAFFNATAFGRSCSLEDGRWVTATAERSAESLGGDLNQSRVRGDWLEYIPLPMADNQVLKLECVGGRGSGDETAQGFFGIGGMGNIQNTTTPGLDRNVTLRGYNENYQVGQSVVKAGASWRFPLIRMYRGENATTPLYYQQLFGELFYEGGKAWGGEWAGAPSHDWLNAVGSELNLSTTLFRFVQLAPGVGVAYAFNREKQPSGTNSDDDNSDEKFQIYLSFKGSVNF